MIAVGIVWQTLKKPAHRRLVVDRWLEVGEVSQSWNNQRRKIWRCNRLWTLRDRRRDAECSMQESLRRSVRAGCRQLRTVEPFTCLRIQLVMMNFLATRLRISRRIGMSWGTCAALLLASACGKVNAAEPFDPGTTLRVAAAELERSHLSKKVLDDDLSRQWLQAFITRLDPNRIYFVDRDLREFQRYQDRLDDLTRQGDFEFPLLVRKRLRKRIEEAVSYAAKYISAEHDFAIDEECPIRFEAHASNKEALEERWRLGTKLEILIEKVHGREREKVQAQLSGRYQRIATQIREMPDERLCELYLNSLASVFDPHSGYVSPRTLRAYTQIAPVKTFRLGINFQQRCGRFTIVSIDSSLGPASPQSDLIGWELIGIRRVQGETIDMVEMTFDDLYHLIHWPMGPLETDTEVILELIHPLTFERTSQSWVRFSQW